MIRFQRTRVATSGLALIILALGGLAATCPAEEAPLNTPPKGFVALFNGKDLTGWKGLVANPIKRSQMSAQELAEAQKAADDSMRAHWSVENGALVFDGKGQSLCTAKDYADFEMLVDWKIESLGDSGIYLRGSPQVQIWDPAKWPEGSGGLYNNKNHPEKPLVCADNPIGQWNSFRIRMLDEKVSVWLNGKLVVDNVVLENYWDRKQPIFPTGQIELQNHGSRLEFRNIYIKELATVDELSKLNAALPKQARVKPSHPRKVLVFTRCTGFYHSSIPLAARAVKALGQTTGAFDVEISEDPAVFEAEILKSFDAVVFDNTTGDWLLPDKETWAGMSKEDQNKARTVADRRRKNLLDFVNSGKGIVGIHAATDSQYDWPEFGKLIGGYFDGHPWHEPVGVRIDEPNHPLCKAFAVQGFTITDEIYQFRDPYSRKMLRVLLSLDPDKTDMTKKRIKRTDGDFAVAWIQEVGKGRVYYNSLGHDHEIFWNPQVLACYLDGIQYALGDLPADAKPRP
jgi:type 1 glutamine amidotransferase